MSKDIRLEQLEETLGALGELARRAGADVTLHFRSGSSSDVAPRTNTVEALSPDHQEFVQKHGPEVGPREAAEFLGFDQVADRRGRKLSRPAQYERLRRLLKDGLILPGPSSGKGKFWYDTLSLINYVLN